MALSGELRPDRNPYAGHTEALAEIGLDVDALDRLYADDIAAQDRFTDTMRLLEG